jgi:glycosyltransferase involved in cell wall biosynthesis
MNISVVTVNYHSEDWVELLVDSLRAYRPRNHTLEVVVVDNSGTWSGPEAISAADPKHHWAGAEKGIAAARSEFVLLLDSDAHVMRDGWLGDLIELYSSTDSTRLCAAWRRPPKYYHPCVMFFRKDHFASGGSLRYSFRPYRPGSRERAARLAEYHSPHPDADLDVGVDFALRTIDDGYEVQKILGCREGYECRHRNKWGTVYALNGKPTIYHHGFSSRFEGGRADEINARTRESYERSRKDLFAEYRQRTGR